MKTSSSRAALLRGACLVLLASIVSPHEARAQVAKADMAPCTYRSCALSIAPRWNGLAVVRGTAGPSVANLGFFWPHDVSAALRGPVSMDAIGADAAVAEARRALELRRIGAVLTDGGLVLGAVALVRALRAGKVQHGDGILVAAGTSALGVSIPFQFAADGALSRAVWWHNLRYAR